MALSKIDSSSVNGLGYGFKNRIINGDMRIDQRNAGASVTPASGGYSSIDRWRASMSAASKYSMQQNAGSVTPPIGFTNYLGMTSTSAYSIGAGDYFRVLQNIEGFNTADFGWGTSGAASVTLSFWVRSSLTGTFGGTVQNGAGTRSYPYTYTISAANTWEYKTVTIAGDTSGSWPTNNTTGILVGFGLGVGATYSGTAGSWSSTDYASATGAVSVVGTSGATFYITGVQLEKGTVATEFDYRPYTTELQLCQRYYYRTQPAAAVQMQGSGVAYSTTASRISMPFFVQMRDVPVSLEQSGTAANYGVLGNGGWITCSAVPAFASASTSSIGITFTVASGLTAGGGAVVRAENTSGYIGWSAEL